MEASVLIPGTIRLGSVGGINTLIIQKISAIIKFVTKRGNLRRISSPFTFILTTPQPEERKNKFHTIDFQDNIKGLPRLFEDLQVGCRRYEAKVSIAFGRDLCQPRFKRYRETGNAVYELCS
jgi:hypothetical protein